jgi:hypothetical protein
MPKRKSWTQGAQKAYDAITDRYGPEEGEHIFYARATKISGTAGSINKRASQAFKTGGTQKPNRGKR